MSALSVLLSTYIRIQVSCTECTGQRNDLELITMVKMETRHPVEGYFVSEFLAICYHRGVIS